MDPSVIAPIVIGLSGMIGLPFALWSRRKDGPQKAEDLCRHLVAIGVEASMHPKDPNEPEKRSLWQRTMGIIKVANQNIDSIEVIGAVHQYGVNYSLDYLVSKSGTMAGAKKQKTRLKRKKSSLFKGKGIDLEWRGDDYLAQRLTFDYRLKNKILESIPKDSIEIIADPKQEYVRIKTPYSLPTPAAFEVINIIAGHVRY
ncbi:MAG: hypothetical protein SVM79_09635 [Chloroflexota bacterium]|nr:hypothetical protein [Chloroflexota bacterium]